MPAVPDEERTAERSEEKSVAMGRNQKIVTTVLWAFLVAVMVGVVGTGLWARRGGKDAEVTPDGAQAADRLTPLFQVPAFSFVNQDEEPVTDKDLRGEVWVAAFIFTNCVRDCPMMTQKFQMLQDATRGTGLKLVSFTLDPERDTPERLRQYARDRGADTGRWQFLTGPQEQVMETARKMWVGASPADPDNGNEIAHGDWFLLIDANGVARGYYRSKEGDTLARVAEDAAALLAEAEAGGGGGNGADGADAGAGAEASE